MANDEAPPLGLVLRHYGPALAVTLALGATGAALALLHGRLTALEARVGALEVPASAAVPASTTWTCTGAIDPAAVLATIGQQGHDVMACMDEVRARRPELQGALQLRLRVDANGGVARVVVTGVDDAPLAQCAERAALRWTFPAPTGGGCATVEAPFGI